jgi:DNA-binding SARP family transcriptional activator
MMVLIYLAYQGEWISRDALVNFFRPEADEATAKHHLRVLLNRIKQFEWANLDIQPHRLRWKIPNDVSHFRAAIGKGDWKQAVLLHKKPLLDGFTVKDAPGFEAWLEIERENLLSAYQEACTKYALELEGHQHYLEAATILERALELDPLAEDCVQRLVKNLYLSGKRKNALETLEAFKQHLKSELGLEPLPETQTLLQTIQQSTPLVVQASTLTKDRIPLSVLHPPVLIGRDKERSLLNNTSSNVIFISGEAGIGKTRFLQEAFPEACWLYCREGLENLPYYPIIEYLKTLNDFSFLGVYKEEISRLIPDVLPTNTVASDPETSKIRLLEALARVLEYQKNSVVIDDLQWADTATLECLTFLASRKQIRFVGAFRPNDHNLTLKQMCQSLPAFLLSLEPLQAGDIYTLLISMMQHNTHPDLFSKWLYERSGGNAFFALETLRYLFEQGVLEEAQQGWHTSLDSISQGYQELYLPPKVAQMIAQRTAHLSPATQRVLQAASVIREGFSPRVLSHITGLSELATVEALEEAETAHLLKQDKFSHDLIRQSLYANLAPMRRKVLHGLVAQTLDKAEPSLIATHYLEAEDKPQAINYFYKAAQLYTDRGQHQSVIEALKRCTELGLENHPQELEILLSYGNNLVWQDNQQAEEILEKAYKQAQDKQDATSQARATAFLLSTVGYSGNGEKANFYLDQAIFWSTQSLPDSVRLELLEAITETAPRAKAFDKAIGALQEAKRLAPQSPSVLAHEAELHFYQGHFLEAKAAFENLMDVHPQAVRSLTIENDLGISCTLAGLLNEGKSWLEKSLGTWKGITHVEALTNSNMGYTLFLMGHYKESLNYLQLAEAQSRRINSQTFLADSLYRQAGVYFYCGHIQQAQDYLNQSLEIMREVDDPYRLAYITATAAVIETTLKQEAKAQNLLKESEQFATLANRPLPWVFYHRACAMIHLQNPKKAKSHIQSLQELAQNHHMQDHLAFSYFLEAQISKGQARENLLKKSLAISEERGYLELSSKALNALSQIDAAYRAKAQEVEKVLEGERQEVGSRRKSPSPPFSTATFLST